MPLTETPPNICVPKANKTSLYKWNLPWKRGGKSCSESTWYIRMHSTKSIVDFVHSTVNLIKAKHVLICYNEELIK